MYIILLTFLKTSWVLKIMIKSLKYHPSWYSFDNDVRAINYVISFKRLVANILADLNIKKSCGPDCIPPKEKIAI